MATPLAPIPPPPVGYIGYGLLWDYPIRGMNFNVKAHQQVFNGDPASNYPDQPIWHVGPLEVDGDVSWPIVYGDPVTYKIIQAAINRTNEGNTGTWKTLEKGNITCFFPPGGPEKTTKAYTRTAQGCMINRLSFKGTAGERVEASINVLGLRLTEGFSESTASSTSGVPFEMGRVVTWGDVKVDASMPNPSSGEQTSVWGGCTIKEFNFEINNNVTRAVTYGWPESADMNGTDIASAALILGRRHVSGSLTFMGSATTQFDAVTNMTKQYSNSVLDISFGVVKASFYAVVYEMQQIDLTSGIIYGRANFTAHGNGPGVPSIKFTVGDAKGWEESLRDLDKEMFLRKL